MSEDDLQLTLAKPNKRRISRLKEKVKMAKSKTVKIQVLTRPGKRSGNELAPGASTTVAGLLIVNQNATSRWVDRQTPKRKAKK